MPRVPEAGELRRSWPRDVNQAKLKNCLNAASNEAEAFKVRQRKPNGKHSLSGDMHIDPQRARARDILRAIPCQLQVKHFFRRFILKWNSFDRHIFIPLRKGEMEGRKREGREGKRKGEKEREGGREGRIEGRREERRDSH